ncbi:MAG: hypothetical protein U5N55_06045, partial [Cypionkella sp.]|nr:hypothetical protein [Cypionkella sp.]
SYVLLEQKCSFHHSTIVFHLNPLFSEALSVSDLKRYNCLLGYTEGTSRRYPYVTNFCTTIAASFLQFILTFFVPAPLHTR